MKRRRFLLNSVIDISEAIITVATQTYNGSAITPTPTVTLYGQEISNSNYIVAYSNNINAGTATITITGKNNYIGIASNTFTINKATPIYTAPTATNYTYNGNYRFLLNAGSSSHGTFYYSSDNSNWSTTRPQAYNAGNYTRYWKLVGDNNHVDVPSTIIQCHINQATGSVTSSPSARSISYTGSAQYLVTSGSGTGTMYYRYRYKSFSSSSYGSYSSYSTSRPKGTNAGYYQVRYYCAASTNYTQSSSSTVTVTLNRATRTISFSSAPSSLGVGSTTTLSASPSAGSGDGTITYSTSNSSVASISGSTLTGVGAGTCTITATISEGTNYSSATTSFTLTVS